jgi:putative ABC transport system substrate-binding protein
VRGMKRRQFLAGLAALFATPAQAQAPARSGQSPRVGIYLTSPLESLEQDYVRFFMDGMRELGWVEGSTIVYERAYATEPLRSPRHDADMIVLAKTLVDRKPDAIWLLSSPSATALLKVTRTIPVVGGAVSEVVERGYAQSLARPGGNFTGVSNFAWELGAKRLEYLHLMMPAMTRVGVLIVPKNPNCERELNVIRKTAATASVTVIPAMMEREEDAVDAFAGLAKGRAEAVLIAHHPLFQNHRKRILQLAADHRIPAVGHRSYFADLGALMTYSTDLAEQMRQSARILDKILKGTKPGDIPVEQPTKTELVMNLRTARSLGLTIPQVVLGLANRIIQ